MLRGSNDLKKHCPSSGIAVLIILALNIVHMSAIKAKLQSNTDGYRSVTFYMRIYIIFRFSIRPEDCIS